MAVCQNLVPLLVHIKIAGFKMDVHPIKNGICIDIDP